MCERRMGSWDQCPVERVTKTVSIERAAHMHGANDDKAAKSVR